ATCVCVHCWRGKWDAVAALLASTAPGLVSGHSGCSLRSAARYIFADRHKWMLAPRNSNANCQFSLARAACAAKLIRLVRAAIPILPKAKPPTLRAGCLPLGRGSMVGRSRYPAGPLAYVGVGLLVVTWASIRLWRGETPPALPAPPLTPLRQPAEP